VRDSFPLNAKVRFTQERLSILSPRDKKSLDGRIGVVEGYWNGTRKPTVNFSEDGGRGKLRLLRVDPQHLELVEASPVQTEIGPKIGDDSDANRKLSQSELDNLFG
jgi:hypothetical protein